MLDLRDIMDVEQLNINDFFSVSSKQRNDCRMEIQLHNENLPVFSNKSKTFTKILKHELEINKDFNKLKYIEEKLIEN